MRSIYVLALTLALLAGCGASEPAPSDAAATPASAPSSSVASPAASAGLSTSPGASAQASLEPAASASAAPQPTLVPTASPAPSQPAASASAAASATAPPSQAGAPPLERTLQLAEPRLQGDDVRLLQQRLADLGYTQVGQVDGIFGPMTQTALRAFQQLNGIEVDGIAGQNTWALLFGDGLGVSALTPVVALTDRWLLGGSVGGRWLDGPATAPLLTGNQTYRIAGSSATLSGGLPEILGAPCDQTWFVPLSPEAPAESDVALGGTWELQPRPVSEADPTEDTFRQVVGVYLNDQGIAQPDIRVDRVLRADLDGNGSQETLVSASRFESVPEGLPVTPDAAAGDYSFVVMLREGEAAIIALESNVFPEAREFFAPYRFTLAGVYDLNGDGRMEVVVDGDYYEGGFTAVYDPLAGELPTEPDGTLTPVLSAGCGA